MTIDPVQTCLPGRLLYVAWVCESQQTQTILWNYLLISVESHFHVDPPDLAFFEI